MKNTLPMERQTAQIVTAAAEAAQQNGNQRFINAYGHEGPPVRADLYSAGDKIFSGELTFTPDAGTCAEGGAAAGGR